MNQHVATRLNDFSQSIDTVAVGADAGPRLTAEQHAMFERDGFLLVEGLSTPEEIKSLRSLYDRLFSERRGWENGDLFDMVGRDDLKRGLALPQMLWPSRYEPMLQTTRLAVGARSIATQLLGPKIENTLEHAIMKPPTGGAITPWHQDDAFIQRSSRMTESISIWMPLTDVTVEMGCMRYIRGSNHGPLFPHRSPNNDPRIHGLEMVTAPDLTQCVDVPMSAGSAVVHHYRTIHGAGQNVSSQPRRAYVLGYAVKGRGFQFLKRDHPWNLEKQTAREQREVDSLSPLKRAMRRVRRIIRGQN